MRNLLEYKGYHAKIEISEDDGIFVGEVVGINDSLNFHGSTLQELKDNFKICIDGYLDMCRAFNKKPEKEYKGSLNIRISPELHKKLDVAAAENGISLNQEIFNILSSHV